MSSPCRPARDRQVLRCMANAMKHCREPSKLLFTSRHDLFFQERGEKQRIAKRSAEERLSRASSQTLIWDGVWRLSLFVICAPGVYWYSEYSVTS